MGTNYYVVENECSCCKRYDEEYHIGKASYGWAFSFQGYPWLKLASWKEWKEFLKDKKIRNEYRDEVSYDEFCKMVETYKAPKATFKHKDTDKKNLNHYEEGVKQGWYNPQYDWIDADGYSFTSREFQ